jgi:hypothetical protein
MNAITLSEISLHLHNASTHKNALTINIRLSPVLCCSGIPRNFFGGGVQQIQLTEGRENRDLGAVAP